MGVVCGRARSDATLSTRSDPADVCLARGTFNSHPYVMGAMHEFLHAPGKRADAVRCYRDLDARLGAPCRRAQRATAGRGAAGSSGESLVHLDRQLPQGFALQLDVPVLPARAGPGPELDGHRHGSSSASTTATRTSPRSPTASWRRPRRCSATAGGGRIRALTNKAIRRRVLRELLQAWWTTSSIGSISSPRSKCSGARQ